MSFLVVKDSQDSIRHYTMIPKRAENFAKNITTRIRFGKENHLDEFATNCNITSSGTLPVTIWERIFQFGSGLGQVRTRSGSGSGLDEIRIGSGTDSTRVFFRRSI